MSLTEQAEKAGQVALKHLYVTKGALQLREFRMKMLNIEHLVSLKKCVYNQRQIESFDLIEGDWIYISGDIEFAQLVYPVHTIAHLTWSKNDFASSVYP